MKLAFFSTKKYDIDAFNAAQKETADAQSIEIVYLEPGLDERTAILAEGCTAVCAFVNDRLDAPTLLELSKLGVKFVALRCAGFNNVDLAKAQELGIKVVRVPAYSPEAVAEFAVGLMLTVIRKYHKAYPRVRDGNFTLTGLEGFNLENRTVGLIGTGKIGLCVGRILAHGFRSKVIAYDPYPDKAGAAAAGITYVDTLDELLERSEIISLHCPLAPSTRYIINENALRKMREGAVLINTSRGALIDTTALVKILKEGRLRAVAIDVYDGEEGYFFRDASDSVIQDDLLSRLLSFHNVFVSGHQAFLTEEALHGIAETTLNNLVALEKGNACPNEVKA
ncbi:D-lactate dehydrogenase [Auricularia subglabra TFB-10046 SS5]|nr:D-lactate dehydrogenase [Auricularia subglabra TFB-10046 SS5]